MFLCICICTCGHEGRTNFVIFVNLQMRSSMIYEYPVTEILKKYMMKQFSMSCFQNKYEVVDKHWFILSYVVFTESGSG